MSEGRFRFSQGFLQKKMKEEAKRLHKQKAIHRLTCGTYELYCWDCLAQLKLEILSEYAGIPIDKLKGVEIGELQGVSP